MKARAIAGCSILLAALVAIPVSAHHSFAMYDQTKVVTLTGVVKQFVPQANHAELHIVMLAPDHKSLAKDKDGKYVEWGVEMAGTAAVAAQGITATTFPPGTVFSVKVNPLRDGTNFGSRISPLAKWPSTISTAFQAIRRTSKPCWSRAN